MRAVAIAAAHFRMRRSLFALGLWRGFCGRGPLLARYLTVVSPCAICGNVNAQYPSDDAPPYFTILIVGHFVVAPCCCFLSSGKDRFGWSF